MEINTNFLSIDVIFLAFCAILAVIGFEKGFVKRAYDFLGTIAALLLAYLTYRPISEIFTLIPQNEYSENQLFLPIINKIIVFICLFLLFWLIKKIIGILIKPLLEKIVSILSLTDLLNHLLGMFLSLIEALVISYFALTLMLTPLVDNGYQLINESHLAKEVLKIVPDVSQKVMTWSQQYSTLYKTNDLSTKETLHFLLSTYQMGLINDEQMTALIENEMKDYLLNHQISLDENDRKNLIGLIDQTNLSDELKLKMKNRVSGEHEE